MCWGKEVGESSTEKLEMGGKDLNPNGVWALKCVLNIKALDLLRLEALLSVGHRSIALCPPPSESSVLSLPQAEHPSRDCLIQSSLLSGSILLPGEQPAGALGWSPCCVGTNGLFRGAGCVLLQMSLLEHHFCCLQ